MAIALAPADQSLMVFPAFAQERDDAVGELAEGRGVEPVDHERTVAADPFEAFTRRAFRRGPARRDAHGARRGAFLRRMLEIQNGLPNLQLFVSTDLTC